MELRTKLLTARSALSLGVAGALCGGASLQGTYIGLLEEQIALLEETNSLLRENISLRDELRNNQIEALSAAYPEVRFSPAEMITVRERQDLQEILSTELSQDETMTRAWNNVCVYRHYDFNLDELVRGSCILISPTLLVTNAHMISNENDPFLATIQGVETQFEYRVRPLVLAYSPRYDLALVAVPRFNNVQIMPVGSAEEEGVFTYMSLLQGARDELSVEEGSLILDEKRARIFLSSEGLFAIPGLEMTPMLEHGYSGSPVLQNGNLIGLVAQVSDAGRTTVSDNLKYFLELVVENYDNDTSFSSDAEEE